MKCQNCGHDNPASTAFCENCGELLSHKQNVKANSGGAWGFIRKTEDEPAKGPDVEELDFDNEDIDELEMKFMEGVEDWGNMPGNTPVQKPAKPAKPKAEPPAEKKQPGRRSLFDEADRFAEDAKSAARANAAADLDSTVRMDETIPPRKPQPEAKPRIQQPQRSQRAPQPAQRSTQPARPERQQPKREQPVPTRQQPQAADKKAAQSRENAAKANAKAAKSSKENVSGGKKFLRVLPIILIGLVLIALAYFIYQAIQSNDGSGLFSNGLFAKKQSSDSVTATKVNIDPNDPGRYNITVEADEGTVLVFETNRGPDSRTEHTVSNKKYIIFSVGTGELLPLEPIEQNPCSVTPKIYVKDSKGDLTPVKVDPISITVPEISIVFSTQDTVEAEEGSVHIRGTLTDPYQYEALLTFDGDPIEVNKQDGSFDYTYTKGLDIPGEHKLEFLAKLNGYLINRKIFTVNVNEQLQPEEVIVIPNTIENYTRLSNSDEFIRISGTVPSGTTLTVVSDDPEFDYELEDAGDGKFTIKINTPTPEKVYPFTIIGVTPGGTEYRRTFSVERPPKYSEYVRKCWAENYAEMKKENHVGSKQPFRFKCTITEIIYDEDYILARATLSTAPDTVIEIEYHNHYSTASELKVDEEFTMSGYSLGMVTYEENDGPQSFLRMYIWFVDDKH